MNSLQPPEFAVSAAVAIAQLSLCQSKRGVVIFDDQQPFVLSSGYNHQPGSWARKCRGSDECRKHCSLTALHAEQMALIGMTGYNPVGKSMLHVKIKNHELTYSGEPSCIECAKMALSAGIVDFWLYHESGWRCYEITDFYRITRERIVPTTK